MTALNQQVDVRKWVDLHSIHQVCNLRYDKSRYAILFSSPSIHGGMGQLYLHRWHDVQNLPCHTGRVLTMPNDRHRSADQTLSVVYLGVSIALSGYGRGLE